MATLLSSAATPAKTNIIGLPRPALADALAVAFGLEPKKAKMRSSQIWRWVYHFGVTDFAAMTDIAKDMRAQLPVHFTLARPDLVERQVSKDGTRKYL
ncbi:MAG: 23S rRNA (adenine(2503)-C(2))-methyltransferase RlmN, partial [Pseudomonadota bacterium]